MRPIAITSYSLFMVAESPNFHVALFDFFLTQRLTHSSSLSRVRLARLNNVLSETPSLVANILCSSILARPSP